MPPPEARGGAECNEAVGFYLNVLDPSVVQKHDSFTA